MTRHDASSRFFSYRFLLPLGCAFSFLVGGVHAAQQIPTQLQGAQIEEKLGQQITLGDLRFQNEEGETVPLSSYFSKRPVILSLVYYECPSICTFALSGLMDSIKQLEWNPGTQYDIVTVSFDHREDAALAQAKKKAYIQAFGRPEAAKGWHFLTGDEENIRRLAEQAGFGFKWVAEQNEYAHATGIFVLTPQGKISRVLYGITYPKQDLKLSLLEAADGKIGNVIDKIILYCFRYDPSRKGYALVAYRVVQAGAGVTVVLLGCFYFSFFRSLRRRRLAQEN